MTKYRFKLKPYDHQKEAIRKLISNGYGGALLMEPRTGKTKTAIDYLSILAQHGAIDRVVIICPPAVMDVWVKEFYLNCPVMHTICVWDRHGRDQPPPIVNPLYKLSVLIVNYEAFATPGKRLASRRRSKRTGRFKNRQLILKWLDNRSAACVLDESHKIKSPSGKASNMIVSMQSAFRYRLILTGTPVTKEKRIFDVYMQWKFLNPDRFEDFATVGEFKNHYGKWTSRNGFPQFLRTQNVGELKRRIHEDAFSITRAECFDLPKRTRKRILIPLRTSAAIYDELAEELVASFEQGGKDHTTEASMALTLAIRLAQITGGYAKTTDDEIVQVGTEKLDVFKRLLDEAIENDEKFVVAARYRADLDGIIDLCRSADVPVYPIRGGLTRSEITHNREKFNHAGGVAVCAMNPAAGSLGIDLSSAAHMVWYSLTPSWVDFTQANDRIALSDKPTTFTYLLAKNTVDELLFDTLQRDGDIGREIVKDPRKVLRK